MISQTQYAIFNEYSRLLSPKIKDIIEIIGLDLQLVEINHYKRKNKSIKKILTKQTQEMRQKFFRIIEQVFTWGLAYYHAKLQLIFLSQVDEKQLKEQFEAFIDFLLNIKQKQDATSLRTFYLSQILIIAQTKMWGSQFCKSLDKNNKMIIQKKTIQTEQFMYDLLRMHNQYKRFQIENKSTKRITRLKQYVSSQKKRGEKNSPILIDMQQENIQGNIQADKYENTITKRIRKFVSSKSKQFKILSKPEVCKSLQGYLKSFMTVFIKDMIQYAKVNNQNHRSQTIGDIFKYFSQKGVQENRLLRSSNYMIDTNYMNNHFIKLTYPSKLQNYNNFRIKQFKAQQQYRDKFPKQLIWKNQKLSLYNKQFLANYLFNQQQKEKLKPKVAYLPSPNKKRLVISWRIFRHILVRDQKYQHCAARDFILINYL